MGGRCGPKENSDVESSPKTDRLPGQFFVLRTLVRRYVRSQGQQRALGSSHSGIL